MEEIEIGSMVICNGRTARVANFRGDIAHCIHINMYGDIVDLESPVEDLKPLWLEYSPQSGWPEINQIDDSMLAQPAPRRAAA